MQKRIMEEKACFRAFIETGKPAAYRVLVVKEIDEQGWDGGFMLADKKQSVQKMIGLPGKGDDKTFCIRLQEQREAVCIITHNSEYVLHRAGGNPFHDPVLHRLKGKCITVKGIVHNYTLPVKEIMNEKP